MIRNGLTYLVILLVAIGCTSGHRNAENHDGHDTESVETPENDSIDFKAITVRSDMEGVDSLMIVTANGMELFRIAEGGDVEILSDSVLKTDTGYVGILTLADYFQNDQIFYILYNPGNSALFQSERLYLPYLGMEISEYNQLDSITMTGDSLHVMSREHPEINISLSLDTLTCNETRIINYYELE